MPAILGYWKTRVLAQPIRLLLSYIGEEFEDVRYEMGDGPEFSKEQWLSVKNMLGLPFPNLPYYIDGDVKMTQSNAILRYIAGKHNLRMFQAIIGKTNQEKVDCDVMFENGVDFRNMTTAVTYNPKYEELKDEYFRNLPPILISYEQFLGEKPWFAGENITLCDFPVYELLDVHKIMKPGILESHPKLSSFVERFESIPQIKTYMNSDKFLARPINNKWAGFIGE